ncbi:hypothetical protein C8Q70DRAFT_940807 [Cubamyces menziesii]|nr:hypothetical protein C8Q70DRAFT_940807 [Cubamyces menziesii]
MGAIFSMLKYHDQAQPGQGQPGQGQPGQAQPGQGQPGQDKPGQSSNPGHATSPTKPGAPAQDTSTTNSNPLTSLSTQTYTSAPPIGSSPSTTESTTNPDLTSSRTSPPSETSSCGNCSSGSSTGASESMTLSMGTSPPDLPASDTSTGKGASATDTTSTTSSGQRLHSATASEGSEPTPLLGTPAPTHGLTLSTPSPGFNGPSIGSDGRANRHNSTGSIVGGVIGGLALVLLIAFATILLRRRIRARHTAPSAEFVGVMRHGGILGSGNVLSPVKQDGRAATPGNHYHDYAAEMIDRSASTSEDWTHPLVRQSSFESDERPPAFTPGAYRDPVLEKVRTAAAMREHYLRRESLSTMAGTGAVQVEGRGSEPESSHVHDKRAKKSSLCQGPAETTQRTPYGPPLRSRCV